jgi:uncharacterized circularly permuted ATP-grasp superfamily protein
MPELSKRVLGESLTLSNMATYWRGRERERNKVLDALG